MPDLHLPVLLGEVVAHLSFAAPGLIVDATIGLGGHAQALLESCPGSTLLGLDRDPQAIANTRRRLSDFEDRITLVCSPFAELSTVLAATHSPRPMAVLADFGCSSLQLDSPERGFSFSRDGPLDMRMGDDGPTAADLVNDASAERLMRILWDYGEENRARAIVATILRRREEKALTTTGELSRLVAQVLGRRPGQKIHPATRTFQALRIAVNNELGQIENFVEPAVRSLAPGGRLAMISFHSLEDRIVKHTLRRLEGRAPTAPGPPGPPEKTTPLIRLVNRRPIRPTENEERRNPRSRSARLRVAQKLETPE
ncbi:MAG: 16S rRNA (cytosine(1402)-N(4))-methyltransferase RsmH [Thermoanaerobaculales bacterium]|nr:16S rRNA (cytosine(1402)-N(4))-methyltransferase RsmH [Thermoanaerobaculales bacterium]